jgi:hypothetical protein
MTIKEDNPQEPKISREFESRLDRFDPEQKVRAIVMLQVEGPRPGAGRQQTRKGRHATIESTRRSSETSLPEIDSILERFSGKRLTQNVNALASILVETTPAGIRALAESGRVSAIIEDQPISSMSRLKKAL